MDTLDLLLHPVRLRIVHAMSGGRTRTTAQLCARLPDVPTTTVYRHVGLLAEAEVLEVVDERRIRGAVERHYRLRQERTTIGDDMAASMSHDDHRRGFAAAIAAVLAEFDAYLDRDGADPLADSVGYRQGILWLSPDERTELVEALRETFRSRASNTPTANRRPHLISAIFFPTTDPAPET